MAVWMASSAVKRGILPGRAAGLAETVLLWVSLQLWGTQGDLCILHSGSERAHTHCCPCGRHDWLPLYVSACHTGAAV